MGIARFSEAKAQVLERGTSPNHRLLRCSLEPQREREPQRRAAFRTAGDYLAALGRRKYLTSKGEGRVEWFVVGGITPDEAWERADEAAYLILPNPRSWDWEVTETLDAIRRSREVRKCELVSRRARELVDRQIRAVADACMLVSLLAIGRTGMERWEEHMDRALKADEVWARGFGRIGVVDGRQVVYRLHT